MRQPTRIKIGDQVEIEALMEDKSFVGLGRIWVGRIPLRSARRPFIARLDTPDGFLYTRLELAGIDTRPGGAVDLRLKAFGLPWERTEYLDEYTQSMVQLELPVNGVADSLVWSFMPFTETLGGREWHGFSYSLAFRSPARETHRLLTHATWEIGGKIAGNTVIHQGQCNQPVYHGATKSLFTTSCLKRLNKYGSMQGVSYQLGARGGLLQAFDFQYAKAGALFQYWPEMDSVSSVIESPRGSDLLHIVDECRFPLAKRTATPAKRVLFAPGALAEHEARDLWCAAYERAYGLIRKRAGVTFVPAQATIYKTYSIRMREDRVKMTVAGEEVDHADVLYAMGDKVIPVLAEQGVRVFWPDAVTVSDVTELGMKRKLDDGIHGELLCSSVCATQRFLPADYWGGLKGWKYLADKARGAGVLLGAWFGMHLSPRSEYFKGHPEYRITDVNSLGAGGGYGFNSIIGIDWNSAVYGLILDDIRRWHDEAGLDYLWLDSWPNMVLLQQNYAQRMRTNFAAVGRFLGDVQKLGVRAFGFEGISPFGPSFFGLCDASGGARDPLGGVVGQNDFGWFTDEEDMFYNIQSIIQPVGRTEEELKRFLFRSFANRGGTIFTIYKDDYRLPDWWVRLNHEYNQALPHMTERRLLPGRQGVRWVHGDVQVIWAYTDTTATVAPTAQVEELQGQDRTPIDHAGALKLKGGRVYRISGSAAMKSTSR